MRTCVVWFRRDLRVRDHAALWHACQTAERVIPLFILDPTHFAHHEAGSRRVQFLLECLADLDASLRARGSRLILLLGRAEEVLPRFVRWSGAEAVYAHADIERWSGQMRDRTLERTAAAQGWQLRWFLNYYVQTEGEYDREAWHAAWTEHSKAPLHPAPARVPTPALTLPAEIPHFDHAPSLRDLGLPPATTALPGGETAALRRLSDFLDRRIPGYRRALPKPALAEADGTSRLSSYFKFGCISQRAAIQAARRRWPTASPAARKSLEAWASRLRWRDHFTQKFALYPQAEFINLYAPFDAIRRPEDAEPALLEAWRRGETGYPLVDAAMRALTQTGLLNFRMRAMLATFLTINLFQAWQHGAAWFMQHLLDGDACVDHWQWQMQAGITQPQRGFVRCYNPTKQCFDHDPDATFIHRYVPELRPLPPPLVFRPWTLTPLEQQMFGVRIGVDYPAPIVDAEATRQRHVPILQAIRERLAAAENLEAFINPMAGVTPAVRARSHGDQPEALAHPEADGAPDTEGV
ncbi:MAG: deoxyribodipyrimidine photo-lyase [Anaerolineae bacterium]|nr:DNA photolyase family protein [Candidatus Roseilinea sp.]MDW8448623.1 deoxyribodipyrimidine photo-lyase [Anaerolineae bacterium]